MVVHLCAMTVWWYLAKTFETSKFSVYTSMYIYMWCIYVYIHPYSLSAYLSVYMYVYRCVYTCVCGCLYILSFPACTYTYVRIYLSIYLSIIYLSIYQVCKLCVFIICLSNYLSMYTYMWSPVFTHNFPRGPTLESEHEPNWIWILSTEDWRLKIPRPYVTKPATICSNPGIIDLHEYPLPLYLSRMQTRSRAMLPFQKGSNPTYGIQAVASLLVRRPRLYPLLRTQWKYWCW